MPATLFDIQRKYGESVYPLYKDQMHEPYMENGKGGFQGVVLYDELEDKVKCEECGKWLKFITDSHLKTHKLTSDEYKDTNGLTRKTPLCSVKISERLSQNATKNPLVIESMKKGREKLSKAQRINILQNETVRKLSVAAHKKAAWKNLFGLCDAQIAARIMVCAEMLGKKAEEMNSTDIRKTDSSLASALLGRYGTWELGAKALGLFAPGSRKGTPKYEDAEVIASLRKWVIQNKKIPTLNEYKKSLEGFDQSVITRLFGSWNRAKMMAGLEILYKEITGKLPKEEREEKMQTNLIDSLREYVEKNKKIPICPFHSHTKEETGLPYSIWKYERWFGSWTNAKKEAGLEQLLAEIKSKEAEPVQEETP